MKPVGPGGAGVKRSDAQRARNYVCDTSFLFLLSGGDTSRILWLATLRDLDRDFATARGDAGP